MGLDWIVGARPQRGHETAGWGALKACLAAPDDERLLARWLEVPKVDSWAELDAPIVGLSPEADRWLIDKSRSMRGDPIDGGALSLEELELIEVNRGLGVLELVPDCDGLPVYSNAALNPNLNRTSFRGAFLRDAATVIGAELLDGAHTNMLPDELVAYGRKLRSIADEYASRLGLIEVAARREPPNADDGTPESIAHIVASAARWCLFWSARGHWLNADF